MSHIEFHSFQKLESSKIDEINDVSELARNFKMALEDEEILRGIEDAHQFGASSHRIQEVVTPAALLLGFTSEKKGLFSEMKVPGIRPDFYKPLADGGILMEVERGKTIANNMDLLDVWKTHICPNANHLFLLVPQVRVTKTGGRQKIFATVLNRVGAFFTEKTKPIDVESVNIFGY
jgi:hypothetical protein